MPMFGKGWTKIFDFLICSTLSFQLDNFSFSNQTFNFLETYVKFFMNNWIFSRSSQKDNQLIFARWPRVNNIIILFLLLIFQLTIALSEGILVNNINHFHMSSYPKRVLENFRKFISQDRQIRLLLLGAYNLLFNKLFKWQLGS